jgi:arginine decarboxylase
MSVHLESPPSQRGRAPAHHRVPLVEVLRRYQDAGTVPFSCAGHKLGSGADLELAAMLGAELFRADVWLDTGTHDQALRAAEALAAAAWGADRCFFLGNGSSSGNHAFLLATLDPGDEVIVACDLHKSMLAALILTGARPVYVAPRLHPELGIAVGVHPDDVAAALDAHPAAKLVAVVSPSYFGVAADLAAITRVTHARGVAVARRARPAAPADAARTRPRSPPGRAHPHQRRRLHPPPAHPAVDRPRRHRHRPRHPQPAGQP